MLPDAVWLGRRDCPAPPTCTRFADEAVRGAQACVGLKPRNGSIQGTELLIERPSGTGQQTGPLSPAAGQQGAISSAFVTDK